MGAVEVFGLTAETVEDIVAALFMRSSHVNASFSYDDVNNTLSITATGSGGGSVDWSAIQNKPASFTPSAHSQTASTITDLDEAVQDIVGAMLVSGGTLTIGYDDPSGKVTITGTGADAEAIRDTIGAALIGINGVQIAIDDAADTITFNISGLNVSQITNLSTLLTDASMAGGTVPPVSWGIDGDRILSTQINTMTSAVSGVVRFMDFFLGQTCTFDALQQVITTAESAVSGVVHQSGLYASTADGSMPNVNGGLLGVADHVFTSTGPKINTFTPAVCKPGRYWLAVLDYWPSAPGTYPAKYTINNALSMPRTMNISATSIRHYILTGQTSLPNALTNPAWSFVGDSLTAHVLARRSA